jgi:hypothetical protein
MPDPGFWSYIVFLDWPNMSGAVWPSLLHDWPFITAMALPIRPYTELRYQTVGALCRR